MYDLSDVATNVLAFENKVCVFIRVLDFMYSTNDLQLL